MTDPYRVSAPLSHGDREFMEHRIESLERSLKDARADLAKVEDAAVRRRQALSLAVRTYFFTTAFTLGAAAVWGDLGYLRIAATVIFILGAVVAAIAGAAISIGRLP